jgi:hypothetical protein
MVKIKIPVIVEVTVDGGIYDDRQDVEAVLENVLSGCTACEAIEGGLFADAQERADERADGRVHLEASIYLDKVHANSRGVLPDGRPLDGHLDGWSWKAWYGPFIAYGATEEDAKRRLLKRHAALTKES